VVEAAQDLEAKLVIIDTASDTFGGSENDRNHVRQFVQRALGQIALRIDGALVCCAHPSRAGLSTGDGGSGTTGWSNAFRSRGYLRHVEDEDDHDPNARVLERKKANYAERNAELRLHWRNGVIIPDESLAKPGFATMGRPDVKIIFLDLVREMTAQNRPVSSAGRASNYAPRLFEKLPPGQSHGFSEGQFRRAMDVLFMDKKIANVSYGRKGDERTKIAICGRPNEEKQNED
jgi:RecA-family ATPase